MLKWGCTARHHNFLALPYTLTMQGGPRMRKCRGLESPMIIKVSIMAEAHRATSRKKRPLPPPEQIIGLLLSSELLV